MEFSLKHALVKKIQGDTYNKTEWDRIESKELGFTIVETRKITKNVVANKVKKTDVNTQEVEEVDLPVEDNPTTFGFAKRFIDRETVFNVFVFADRTVKYLFCQHITSGKYPDNRSTRFNW